MAHCRQEFGFRLVGDLSTLRGVLGESERLLGLNDLCPQFILRASQFRHGGVQRAQRQPMHTKIHRGTEGGAEQCQGGDHPDEGTKVRLGFHRALRHVPHQDAGGGTQRECRRRWPDINHQLAADVVDRVADVDVQARGSVDQFSNAMGAETPRVTMHIRIAGEGLRRHIRLVLQQLNAAEIARNAKAGRDGNRGE